MTGISGDDTNPDADHQMDDHQLDDHQMDDHQMDDHQMPTTDGQMSSNSSEEIIPPRA